jgi:hypothetical protein
LPLFSASRHAWYESQFSSPLVTPMMLAAIVRPSVD